MGIMTAIAIKYVANPLSGFWASLCHFGEVVGYARAASHLAMMGYHEESKNCMMMLKKIKGKK
jgi:hypothetical protein